MEAESLLMREGGSGCPPSIFLALRSCWSWAGLGLGKCCLQGPLVHQQWPDPYVLGSLGHQSEAGVRAESLGKTSQLGFRGTGLTVAPEEQDCGRATGGLGRRVMEFDVIVAFCLWEGGPYL